MPRPIRIAAAGDVHCSEANRAETLEAFARLAGQADVLLLAGDLTTHGEPEQAAVLIEACAPVLATMPVIGVLGNHDWHIGEGEALAAQLEDAGLQMLERDHATLVVDGVEVGIAGLKGFVGGFAGSHLPDFGEPLLRRVYAETSRDVEALDASLKAIAHCAVRAVVLHYAPTSDTLEGEPPGIWTMLGTDRLAAPIAEHEPDLVLHGHAHAGRFEGRIGDVPVYNVSIPVLRQAFWIFELDPVPQPAAALH
jgi:Icc-related predicted phosphoesterase